jgi:hypothetical protein
VAKAGDTKSNKFSGECNLCGESVPAGEGIVRCVRGGNTYSRTRAAWVVEHVPKRWVGSPISGRFVGGCTEEADRLKAKSAPDSARDEGSR